jgi:hypothetical protein
MTVNAHFIDTNYFQAPAMLASRSIHPWCGWISYPSQLEYVPPLPSTQLEVGMENSIRFCLIVAMRTSTEKLRARANISPPVTVCILRDFSPCHQSQRLLRSHVTEVIDERILARFSDPSKTSTSTSLYPGPLHMSKFCSVLSQYLSAVRTRRPLLRVRSGAAGGARSPSDSVYCTQ